MGALHLILTSMAVIGLAVAVWLEIRRSRREDAQWRDIMERQACYLSLES